MASILKYNLFLDDIRVPSDVYKYTGNPIYLKDDWLILRNYAELANFLEVIEATECMVGAISFDHDLADSHYSNTMYESKEAYNEVAKTFTEKTGLDCAKFFTKWLDETGQPATFTWACHSMNPVGKKAIEDHMGEWIDRQC